MKRPLKLNDEKSNLNFGVVETIGVVFETIVKVFGIAVAGWRTYLEIQKHLVERRGNKRSIYQNQIYETAQIQSIETFVDITYSTDSQFLTSRQKGLHIHVHFTCKNMQNQNVILGAFFYYSNGQMILDRNQEYWAPNGQVTTQTSLFNPFPDTKFEKVILFIPYGELHLGIGQWKNLYITVIVFNRNNQQIIASNPHYMDLDIYPNMVFLL